LILKPKFLSHYLDETGIKVEDIEKIADAAMDPKNNIHNEPFEISEGLIINAVKMADKIGRSKIEK